MLCNARAARQRMRPRHTTKTYRTTKKPTLHLFVLSQASESYFWTNIVSGPQSGTLQLFALSCITIRSPFVLKENPMFCWLCTFCCNRDFDCQREAKIYSLGRIQRITAGNSDGNHDRCITPVVHLDNRSVGFSRRQG